MQHQAAHEYFDWIDPSCVYLQFYLANTDGAAKRVRPISNGHRFFRRLRVMCENSVLEDIIFYADQYI